jgi:hypothetical protein
MMSVVIRKSSRTGGSGVIIAITIASTPMGTPISLRVVREKGNLAGLAAALASAILD